MSESDFRDYWMRIGTTHKVEEGRSAGGRPLTGSKGIGRLSAQFLASEMLIESSTSNRQRKSLYAIVDWRGVVRGKDLRTVNVAWDMVSESPQYPGGRELGTRITLKGLKATWDSETLRALGDEVWMLRSPFKSAAHSKNTGPVDEFRIEIDAPGISDARQSFDNRFEQVFSNWKARITGSLENGRSRGKATISLEFREGYPDGSTEARNFRETVRVPIRTRASKSKPLIDSASFEILIFKAEGKQPGGISVGDLRDYLSTFGNVSVYDAGFRLPYYGSGRDSAGQDWLLITADQGRRLSISELLPERLRTQNKYMLDLPAPGRIFGSVDINTNHERELAEASKARPGEWLQIQPGRDRLHDNAAYAQLRDLVRFSLDYYANRYRLLDLESVEKTRAQETPSRKYDRVIEVLESNRSEMPAEVFHAVRREVVDARKASRTEEAAIDRRAALLAPLASAGMAALALNHEISREANFLDRIARALRRIARKHSINELKTIADEFDTARRRLDSLRELFSPLLSDLDKSATDRLRVRAVAEHVVSAMKILMPGTKFDVTHIPADLRFPVGSLAEWNALLQNLLSNSWNAMLDSKSSSVEFRGGRDGRGREWLRVSDTGQGLNVSLQEADQLFEPFERKIVITDDKKSIAIGGQGLGLAIVRMIARRRSANVAFVSPEKDFATTFELSWRG